MTEDHTKTVSLRNSGDDDPKDPDAPESKEAWAEEEAEASEATPLVPPQSPVSRARPLAYAGQQPWTTSRQFGRYELLLELAAGGMATLYLARLRGPEGFEKLVALKIIHPHLTRESSFVKMFLDEARIAALVHHPNVVQVLDLGQIADTYYIAMEYIHGHDYRAVLKGSYHRAKKSAPLSSAPDWLIAARVAADTAAGLHAAHELVSAKGESLGLVHRDVSPHNILISYDGHVKLTDFGIAYAKHRITHTDSGVLKGKLAYMSPEQVEGTTVDRRADIFALGIVLWESVCQKRLFRRQTDTATLYALAHAEIPRPRVEREDLPAELEQIILRALAKRPGVRYQTARELGRALEQLIARHDDVIGAAELSAVMTTLFAEQRVTLDREISEVIAEADLLQPTAPTPDASDDHTDTSLVGLPRASGAGSGGSTVSDTRLSAQVLRSLPEPSRLTPPRRWGLIALAVVAAVGLGWYLLLRPTPGRQAPDRTAAVGPQTMAPPAQRPQPRPRPRARPTPRPPAMQRAPDKLVITFVVKPPHARATIFFRQKRYRQNRLDLLVTASETTERVRIEAPGFHPLERFVTVRPEAALKHELTLKPRRRRPGTRPVTPRPAMDMTPAPVDIGFD